MSVKRAMATTQATAKGDLRALCHADCLGPTSVDAVAVDSRGCLSHDWGNGAIIFFLGVEGSGKMTGGYQRLVLFAHTGGLRMRR